jgi:protein translocase SecG subunit
MSLSAILPYIQIVLSIILMGGVLLQRSEAGLGSAFGADSFSSGGYVRRGAEKILFRLTITVAVLFALSAIVALILAR